MKVLLAIDGSPGSLAAVAEVARRPWPADSEFRVILAEPPCIPSIAGFVSKGAFDEIIKAEQGEALKHLQQAVATLAESRVAGRVSSALVEGSPKDVIIAAAEEWEADLIVLGSHGYGPIRRFFLGSISNYIANNAPCSVEIVRPRPTDQPPA